MNTKIIECPNCEGEGGGECVDYDGEHRWTRCPDCLGKGEARQLTDDDDDDIRDSAGFDGFDSHDTYDDWRQP